MVLEIVRNGADRDVFISFFEGLHVIVESAVLKIRLTFFLSSANNLHGTFCGAAAVVAHAEEEQDLGLAGIQVAIRGETVDAVLGLSGVGIIGFEDVGGQYL